MWVIRARAPAMSLGSRLARWETWVRSVARSCWCSSAWTSRSSSGTGASRPSSTARQQFLQQTQQLETLHRELVNAIANLAARDNDDALRAILTDHGINPSAAPRPSGRP